MMLHYSSCGGMPMRSPTVASAGSARVQKGASPQGHKRAEAHLDKLHQLGNDALHLGWRLGCCCLGLPSLTKICLDRALQCC